MPEVYLFCTSWNMAVMFSFTPSAARVSIIGRLDWPRVLVIGIFT